jgi:hypothetical protein
MLGSHHGAGFLPDAGTGTPVPIDGGWVGGLDWLADEDFIRGSRGVRPELLGLERYCACERTTNDGEGCGEKEPRYTHPNLMVVVVMSWKSLCDNQLEN